MFGVVFARGESAWAYQGDFHEEAEVAEALGIVCTSVDLDDLIVGDPEAALAHWPRPAGRTWIYRGFILSPEDYETLEMAVEERGERLWIDVNEMGRASLLSSWLEALGPRTPATVCTETEDPEEAWEEAQEFLGPPPWVIRDHQKSARQLWASACFVPEGTDLEGFAERCANLVDFRGGELVGGIVVRRFVTLAPLAVGGVPLTHEGRPVTDEHRLFFYQGRLVAQAPYLDVDTAPIDGSRWADLPRLVGSRFFVADVARLAGGGTTVIEINDGGHAMLPPRLEPAELYGAIVDDPPR